MSEQKIELWAEKETEQAETFCRTRMQRDIIWKKLRERGYRITKQRAALIDIILENECGSCKEIFYRTKAEQRCVGVATVYRLVNLLEQIGAIDRKNMYKISYEQAELSDADTVSIESPDGAVRQLDNAQWAEVIRRGLEVCGYIEGGEAPAVRVHHKKENG